MRHGTTATIPALSPTLFEQLYKKGYFLSEKQHINRILARQKIQMNIKSKVNIVSG